jgi:hypothetical protein
MLNKHVNLNCLSKEKYIINLDLQVKLFNAQERARDNYSGKNSKIEKNLPGINVINFRILNKSNNSLVYNYVYYRPEFCESLIVYFVIRNYYIRRTRKVF